MVSHGQSTIMMEGDQNWEEEEDDDEYEIDDDDDSNMTDFIILRGED